MVTEEGLREKPTPIPNESIAQGDRVVTGEGRHGVVLRIHRTVMASVVGGQREVFYHFVLRLNSGRDQWSSGPLFREAGDPPPVVPDVTFDGREFLAPSDAWSKVVSAFGHIDYYREKVENARKSDIKRKWREDGVRARREFEAKWRTWAAWLHGRPSTPRSSWATSRRTSAASTSWRPRHPASHTRTGSLTSSARPRRTGPPAGVGDGVWVYIAESRGMGANRGWRIAAIGGHEADIESGSTRLRVPLWMLHRDRTEDAPAVSESFTEPRWLIDLSVEMLIPGSSGSRYPERAAVSGPGSRASLSSGRPVRGRQARSRRWIGYCRG